MSRTLRHQGFRTYRADIRANVGCTLAAADQLEERLEEIAQRRGSRVRIVGHSLGGMLARGVAARRPDLVAGIVTMGSPMLAPGAHHVSLARSVDLLVRLQPRGHAQPDGGGLRGRRLRPGELRPGQGRAARGRRLHRDLLAARRHRRLAGVRRPRRARGRGPLVARRAWRSTPRSSPRSRRRCGRRRCPHRRQLSKSIVERSRSFESRCSAVIERTVPLRERITSECVVTPSPR